MNKISKKFSTLIHLCKTYGVNVIGENNDEVFLNSPKPIKSLEKMISKITGKLVSWQSGNHSSDNNFIFNNTPLSTEALEKIIISLIEVAINAGATKIRLEPGTKEYRWRIYKQNGWTTLQYLPTGIGKQICDFVVKKIGITDIHLPQHSSLCLKNHNLKCSLQPVWHGIVMQLDLAKNHLNNIIEIPELFSKSNFSNLFLINQRRHQHKHSLAQQIEDLSKKHDVITIGDKIGLNELATDFPTKDEDLQQLISNKPELVIINHHDIVNVVNLVKTLQENNIKSIVNLTSYSPWPLLNYLSNQKLNSDALIISFTGEKVCHDCKKQIDSDIKIHNHNQTGDKGWLEKDIWENQTCNNNHEDEDFYVVVENWNGDLNTVDKKITEHIDRLILNGILTWQNKSKFLQDKDNNLF